ncbi:hypothetical protein QBC38DRAFT_81286 [Podospora fimiseda]|uniref:Uncharacterized protein n=1 Tax=Podospora fimiseda TaxID=252190 RepID=A0AAN7BG69_9PEZI|nr:hypothetical protein QBC38DRAFT_81286 [Podospora fimiseda]
MSWSSHKNLYNLALPNSHCSLQQYYYCEGQSFGGLGPPRNTDINTSPDYSWTKNNSSAYLWGAGLWTACKESRMVFLEKLHQELPRPVLLPTAVFDIKLRDKHATCTKIVPSHVSGQDFHLMVQPFHDLLLLRPLIFGRHHILGIR